MGYLRDTIKGVSWMGGLKVVMRSFSFVRIAVLARILSKAQFGVFAIAGLVLVFLEKLTETGINIFLIQERGDIKKYLNTAWIVSILRGAIISLLILISSPLIINFFDTPDALPLLLLISVVPLIRGFINPSIISFRKDLQFRKEFFFRSFIFFTDAFSAIMIALITRQAIALVCGLVIGAVFEVAMSYIFIRPWPKLSWELPKFKKVIGRGKWITASEIVNYLATHIDDIVVGKILSTASLGVYQMAYKISELPLTEISNVVGQVAFPIYSKITSDASRLKKAYVKTSLTTAALSIAFGLFLFIFAREAVLIVLGDSWLEVIPILRILSIFGMIKASFYTANSLFYALKKQEYVTAVVGLNFVVLLILVIPLTQMYGLIGTGVASIISVIIIGPLVIYYLYRVFGKNK